MDVPIHGSLFHSGRISFDVKNNFKINVCTFGVIIEL